MIDVETVGFVFLNNLRRTKLSLKFFRTKKLAPEEVYYEICKNGLVCPYQAHKCVGDCSLGNCD